MYDFRDVCLIQFSKIPQPGEVKTRMLPVLTPQQACQLHSDMMAYSASIYTQLSLSEYQLWYAGDDSSVEAQAWLAECNQQYGCSLHRQVAGDLGVKMRHAAAQALKQHELVIIVGSDCPFISADYLSRLLTGWDGTEKVYFGPASDGGYVLLAMNELIPGLFENIPWGQSEVLKRSRQQLSSAKVEWGEMPPLNDIDLPEDLSLLKVIPSLSDFSAILQ